MGRRMRKRTRSARGCSIRDAAAADRNAIE